MAAWTVERVEQAESAWADRNFLVVARCWMTRQRARGGIPIGLWAVVTERISIQSMGKVAPETQALLTETIPGTEGMVD